jgi:Flp pilus assembly pilin Flp
MKKITRSRLIENTEGASVVEYLLLIALVAFVIIAGFGIFAENVSDKAEEAGGEVGNLDVSLP